MNRATLLKCLQDNGINRPEDSPLSERICSPNPNMTSAEVATLLGGNKKSSKPEALVIPTIILTPNGYTKNHSGMFIPDDLKPIQGLIHPIIDPDFKLSEVDREVFKVQISLGKDNGQQMNTLLKGPQGCGKTSKAMQFAAHAGLPVLKESCPLKRETRDWFGYKTASAGDVSWVETQFVESVRRGYVVICLDELTRCAPAVLNSLLPLMDDTHEAFVEEIKDTLKVGPYVYFFATANIGQQFVGAHSKIDAALEDRFGIIMECDFLSEKEEIDLLVSRTGIEKSDAAKLVGIANCVRNGSGDDGGIGSTLTQTISTRTLLSTARLFVKMGSKAFHCALLTKFSGAGGTNSERASVMQIIQAKYSTL